jgi:uncharacterized protein YbjT (DUF2867 family)
MAALPLVTVITASSNSGSQAVRDLCEKYHDAVRVRACFRTSGKADALKDAGADETIIGVDALKVETLTPAFEGATIAVVVTPHDMAAGFQDDALMTENMIREAVRQDVKHVIYVGSWTAGVPECCPTISSRFVPTEALLTELEATGLKWTNLRSGFFFQNFARMFAGGIRDGTVRFPNHKVAACDPRDMGRVAAAIAAGDSDAHHGKIYDISGPEMLEVANVVKTLGDVLGKTVVYEPITAASMTFLPPWMQDLQRYMEDNQEKAVPFSSAVKDICGTHCSFSAWLAENKNLFLVPPGH